MPSKSQVKAYFAMRRLHGKYIANKYYPNIMWYLWEKRVDYTYPTMRLAVLDTHVLKYLKMHHPDAPKATPTYQPTYKKWEDYYLTLADAVGIAPIELDKQIYRYYAGGGLN